MFLIDKAAHLAAEADEPKALKATEPVAVTLRSVVDSTVCVASVRASATPIDAVPPLVSP